MIAAPNDHLYERLSQVLGHPEWPRDARFDSNQKRFENIEDLNACMTPVLKQHTREYWRDKLDEAGIPSAPVRDTVEMMQDEQTRALEIIQGFDGREPRLMGMPLSFDGARPPLTRLAPLLGEHNKQIKDQ